MYTHICILNSFYHEILILCKKAKRNVLFSFVQSEKELMAACGFFKFNSIEKFKTKQCLLLKTKHGFYPYIFATRCRRPLIF